MKPEDLIDMLNSAVKDIQHVVTDLEIVDSVDLKATTFNTSRTSDAIARLIRVQSELKT